MKYCSAPTCDRRATAKGYCSKHRKQIIRHGRLTPERERLRYSKDDRCKAQGCNLNPKKLGLCERHYRQLATYGQVLQRTIHDKNKIVYRADHAELILETRLAKGVFSEEARVLVDICDVPLVSQFKWSLDKDGYARSSKLGTTLHRLLLNPPDGLDIDHKNGNRLDNRRKNIRVCTRSENNVNSTKTWNRTSGFRGVSWNKQKGKWEARVWKGGRVLWREFFDDLDEAVLSRHRVLKNVYGEYVPNPRKDVRVAVLR